MQLFNPENTARVRLLYFVSSLKNLFLRFGSDSVFFCFCLVFLRVNAAAPHRSLKQGLNAALKKHRKKQKKRMYDNDRPASV